MINCTVCQTFDEQFTASDSVIFPVKLGINTTATSDGYSHSGMTSNSVIESFKSCVDDDQISLTESRNEDVYRNSDVYFVSRPIYNKSNFCNRYDHEPNKEKTFKEKVRELKLEVSCEKFTHVLLSFVPLLTWLPKYRLRKYLPMDIAAGFTIGVMNIPQG